MSETTATKPAPKPRKKAAPAKVVDPVLYPEIDVKKCFGREAITYEQMKAILGWENEEEYRMRLGDPKAKLPPNSVLLTDIDGQPVACWHNTKNREFKPHLAKKYRQEVLDGNWQINGETFIISAAGQVHSGQHRGIGYIQACQDWAGPNKHKYRTKWPTMPTLETIVVTGISDDPKVVRTIDNGLARSEADVFYTSPLFAALEPSDKKECSRMLSKAVDFLWQRTGADNMRGGKVYQTHSQSLEFVDPRHATLMKCLKCLFQVNSERAISNLKLSPGQCAAMMYLMAASKSDGDVYRNEEPAPSEKSVDFELYDKAEEFWDAIGSGEDSLLMPLRAALGALVDPDSETGGRLVEKVTVIAKAWAAYRDGIPLSYTVHGPVEQAREPGDLGLTYAVDAEGTWRLLDRHGFDGIDVGPAAEPEIEPEVSPEELEAAKIAERKWKAEQLMANLKRAKEAKAARNGEVEAEPVQPTKHPTPKPSKVQQEQTRKAAEADAQMAEEQAAAKPTPHPKPKKS